MGLCKKIRADHQAAVVTCVGDWNVWTVRRLWLCLHLFAVWGVRHFAQQLGSGG